MNECFWQIFQKQFCFPSQDGAVQKMCSSLKYNIQTILTLLPYYLLKELLFSRLNCMYLVDILQILNIALVTNKL